MKAWSTHLDNIPRCGCCGRPVAHCNCEVSISRPNANEEFVVGRVEECLVHRRKEAA